MISEESPYGVVTNTLDYKKVVNKFKLQLCYYIHFQTNAPWERYEPTYSPLQLCVK